ncbi:hypothetical protein [Serratia proteamaculans]|uniref:hypothetical protein n=1 Tax=Serratia proteamaculans TaxID=28151 RepID=UPI00142EC342|nr:hypothetical protein [Serratia proteamaculans]
MLKNQWVLQKSREMALHYIAHAGVVYSPEEFIKKVSEMEGRFASILLAEQSRKPGA